MKLKAHSVAFTLRNRFMRRGLDDEHAQNPRRQPATNDVTPVRIVEPGNAREMPEDGPDDRDYQRTDPDEEPKDTLWFYLLGIATILYLIALMAILL
ncbi:hypothetical protein SRABI26_00501 [Arthrobacter sp. Bi26]|uniref:hypothetical protein n=1 Tax=Arthrobacter sp. Bi26 TaxID=2822350 RepID=UPI001D3AC6EE|nr:hypothetical protein [Arthrobacter sp. Bi26]CAH0142357.1 hypothetical protein SRABI26_00501 [Arthrobacter sp. Bi26]